MKRFGRRMVAASTSFIFSVLFTSAQPFPSVQLGRAEGMATEHVVCLAEDSTGLLWIGTEEGLLAYDGVGFEHYTTADSGLSGNGFTDLWAAPDGRYLWLGLKSGLAVMDLLSRLIRHVEIPDFYNIADLATAADGGLWVVNIEDRLCHIDLRSSDVKAALCGASDIVVPATVYELRDFGPIGRRPEAVRDCGDGLMQLDYHDGRWLINLRNHSAREVARPAGWSVVAERRCLTDRWGNLWQGSTNGLVCATHRGSEFRLLPLGDSPVPVTAVLPHADGSVWIGTSDALTLVDAQGSAVRRVDLKSWYGHAGAYPHVICRGSGPAVGDAESDVLLVGTEREGLWLYDCTSGLARRLSGVDEDLNVYAILRWHGQWLIGTSDGVYEWDGVATTISPSSDINRELPSHYVYSLVVDAEDKLWVGIYGSGIQVFDSRRRHVLSLNPRESGFTSGAINHLLLDRRGRLWAATLEGVVRFDDTRQPDHYVAFTQADGLPSLYVRALAEDDEGRIWATTNQGIARWDEQRQQFYAYERRQGLPRRPFCNRALALLDDGSLVAGSDDGLLRFTPHAAALPQSLPPLRLISFKLLRTDGRGGTLQKIVPADSLSFGHGDNSFVLTFGLTDVALSGMVEYAYRLRGGQSGWTSLGGVPRLTLHSLSPGSYTVEMRVRQTGQPWPDDVSCSVTFRVRPPWWMSWWAYVLYAVLGAGLLGYIMNTYRRRLVLENNLRYANDINRQMSAKLEELLSQKQMSAPPSVEPSADLCAADAGTSTLAATDDPVSTLSQADQQLLSRLSEVIYTNLDNPDLDIDLLCDRMAMSRSTLYRKVKSMLGMSANEYIRWVRLGEAARRIKNGDLSDQTITAIASDCGFSSLSYFRTCFRERFGVTPGEYGKTR